jgi:transglutaminase-like putative cysteine protease
MAEKMRRAMSAAAARVCLGALLAGAAGLSPTRGYAQTPRSHHHEVDARVVVRDDRTYTARQTVRTRLETERGLARAQSVAIPFIKGLETLTLGEAYIERADGTRTVVDPATAKIERPSPQAAPDAHTLTIAFPDPKVGDTIVYVTDRDVTTASFDGHFSYAWAFHRAEPWQKARHVVDVPRALTLHVDLVDPSGALKHERADRSDASNGDRTVHTVTYQPEATAEHTEEPGATAPADRDPRFTLTTFADHEAFAAAYWTGAAAALWPTPALTTLAAEITRDLATDRDKVVAVDRWLKRNIRYQNRYLGRERWVPRAASTVLESRSGDCKDMVVLAATLLAAVGVASEHVLVNLGTAYELPALPPASFNHVMLHVPTADLTIDPAAVLAVTGVLSLQAYDKPALHVGPRGVRRARTPAMQATDHTTHARTTLTVSETGVVAGETTQTATGIFAASARAAAVRFLADGPDLAAASRLTALRTPGAGRLTAASPSELKEPFVVTATFTLTAPADLPLAGNRSMPIGLPIHARPGQFLLGPRVADRRTPFNCFAGKQVEDIQITFAPALALPRLPQGKSITGRLFTYEATYALDGRTFKTTRTFTARVPGQVCSAALEAELSEPLKEVTASLGTMLAFPGSTAAPKKRP